MGTVVTSTDHVVVSTGFNGFPRGDLDRSELLDDAHEKLNWMCHAEANAIFNAARRGTSLVNCALFTTKFPCLSCCRAIIQAGINKICTHDDSYWDDDPEDRDDDSHKLAQHDRKRTLLRTSAIRVVAPFHRDWGVTESHRPQWRVVQEAWNRAS